MSDLYAGPLTSRELASLHELGYEWFTEDSPIGNIVEAYRAGFRDGIDSERKRLAGLDELGDGAR